MENALQTSLDISSDRELNLLDQIETDPDVTQASLAAQLGVAVGTVNWHLKRLVAKGYVKVKRARRRKLQYILTPEGMAFRAHLAVHYIETSMRLYRNTRQQVLELLAQLKQAGFEGVYLDGGGDIADICRLTCLEQGVRVMVAPGDKSRLPRLEVHGTKVVLRLEQTAAERLAAAETAGLDDNTRIAPEWNTPDGQTQALPEEAII